MITILLQRCVLLPFNPFNQQKSVSAFYLCNKYLFISLQSKEEYEASVCLCGSQVCRGSYLNLTGEGAFEKVEGVLKFYV